MDAVAHFTQLARYNVWATARVLDAVRALPEEAYRRDVGLFFKSIHGTLNHLLVVSTICGSCALPKASHPRWLWTPSWRVAARSSMPACAKALPAGRR